MICYYVFQDDFSLWDMLNNSLYVSHDIFIGGWLAHDNTGMFYKKKNTIGQIQIS